MNQLSKLVTFLTTQAKPLTWAMALIALNLLIGGFFEQQGHWEFDNEIVAKVSSYLSLALYLLVVFRLIKPNGVQDIKALILLPILPNLEHPLMDIGRLWLMLIVLAFRWTKFSRVVGLTAIALSIWMGSIATNCLTGISVAIPYSPKTGEFCSKTDGIYFLYKFHYSWVPKPVYGLFRQVPILPGVQLVKRVDLLYSRRKVCVCRTPEGNYTIVDGPPEVYK
ncbi:hypothetical protein KBI23_10720 [bacterium]|nr:hypothetical protein [bacterium]MBP9810301.1 hypothetical protein [bacterium]